MRRAAIFFFMLTAICSVPYVFVLTLAEIYDAQCPERADWPWSKADAIELPYTIANRLSEAVKPNGFVDTPTCGSSGPPISAFTGCTFDIKLLSGVSARCAVSFWGDMLHSVAELADCYVSLEPWATTGVAPLHAIIRTTLASSLPSPNATGGAWTSADDVLTTIRASRDSSWVMAEHQRRFCKAHNPYRPAHH